MSSEEKEAAQGEEKPNIRMSYLPQFVDRFGRRVMSSPGHCKITLDPFSVTRNFPNQSSEYFTIDVEGCRLTNSRGGLPKLVITGGSSAFGAFLASDSETFAWRLSDLLPGFTCVNAGVTGHQTGEELSVVMHRFSGTGMCAHISFTGYNDLVGGWIGRTRDKEGFGFQGLYYALEHHLHGYYCLSREEGPITPAGIPLPAEKSEPYFDRICKAFQSNLLKMHLLSKGQHARFIAVFQPDVSCKDRLTDCEKSRTESYYQDLYSCTLGIEDVGRRFRVFINRAIDFCNCQGIEYLDMNHAPEFAFCEDELFYDPCHFNEQGHKAVAEILAQRLSNPH